MARKRRLSAFGSRLAGAADEEVAVRETGRPRSGPPVLEQEGEDRAAVELDDLTGAERHFVPAAPERDRLHPARHVSRIDFVEERIVLEALEA
jgi:hypothetical protein